MEYRKLTLLSILIKPHSFLRITLEEQFHFSKQREGFIPFIMGRFNILPLDIITEILTRLPTEGVLECKLVCKTWLKVVRRSSFSQLHLSHLNSSDENLCKLNFITVSDGELTGYHYIEYDEICRQVRMDLDIPFKTSFIGSSNGIICLGGWLRKEGCEFLESFLYGPCILCNPITREYVYLPPPERCNMWTGFGYIVSTNEYKVVRIYASGGDSNVGIVQIYTLGSGIGWRNAGTMDINMEYVKPGSGKFANGALHWVTTDGTIIHAFHLADEEFSEFPSPIRPDDVNIDMKLGVLCDCLSVIWKYCGVRGYKIWLLKKKNENSNDLSWSEEFYFEWPWPFGWFRQDDLSWPIGYTKSGRILWCKDCRFFSYDPESSTAKWAMTLGAYLEAFPHKNTLVSLKQLGENDTKTMKPSERASSSKERKINKWRRKLRGFTFTLGGDGAVMGWYCSMANCRQSSDNFYCVCLCDAELS